MQRARMKCRYQFFVTQRYFRWSYARPAILSSEAPICKYQDLVVHNCLGVIIMKSLLLICKRNPFFFMVITDQEKTTIIRLIYNLLSSEKGTKTAIANIPFKAFSLYLKNGGTLSVHRQDNLIGDYSITYEKNGSTQSYSVHASAENRVLSGKNPEMSSIKKLIDSFQLKLFYVTHDRVLKTNDTRIKVHESSEPDDLSSDDHWGSYTLFQRSSCAKSYPAKTSAKSNYKRLTRSFAA